MASLRGLPKVDVLAASPRLAGYPVRVRVQAARATIESLRQRLQNNEPVDLSSAESNAAEAADALVRPSLGPLINASGVILHTGAGRARLSERVADHVRAVAANHSNVEIDLDTGLRGDRQTHVRESLCRLTGAEDAFVVNNCAAAVVLTLSALAAGCEVILSRGEMVEIGGAFRMPDIVRQSGCRLVEVGCTNKTHVFDYEQALTPDTAAILRCHPSNFRIIGFAETPSHRELAPLIHAQDGILIDDMGSGCLIETTDFGLPAEARMGESLSEGADLLMASADKMLGGPQAGMILGRRDLIKKVRQHPLARAVRVDKLTLAALEMTLRLYEEGEPETQIPTLRYLSRTLDEVQALAEPLAASYPGAILDEGITETGGGSLPGAGVKTIRVGLPCESPDQLAWALRQARPPVLARIERGLVWLDPRTLEPHEVTRLCEILGELA